ncbi:MAG: hypothetical protein ACRD3O_00040 [Terriglobia bacterium]
MAQEFADHMAALRARAAENSEVARQMNPAPQIERSPSAYQKEREKSGDSSWSGASGGGGTWAGRSR